MNFRNHLLFLFLSFLLITCTEDDTIEISDKAPDGHYLQLPGTSAHEFLSDERFDNLTIQIAYASGFKPENKSINQLNSFLHSRINKPKGIYIQMNEISPATSTAYTLDNLFTLENSLREAFTQDNSLTVFILLTDGIYAEDENTLGVAFRNTSIALFGKKIHELSGQPGQPGRALLEATVLNHEFGHLLGLVNGGTPMRSEHQDIVRGRHCIVTSCLMHYRMETTAVASILGEMEYPPSLDPQCIADLQHNEGR